MPVSARLASLFHSCQSLAGWDNECSGGLSGSGKYDRLAARLQATFYTTALHCTALHCIDFVIHYCGCITLPCTTLHYTALYSLYIKLPFSCTASVMHCPLLSMLHILQPYVLSSHHRIKQMKSPPPPPPKKKYIYIYIYNLEI